MSQERDASPTRKATDSISKKLDASHDTDIWVVRRFDWEEQEIICCSYFSTEKDANAFKTALFERDPKYFKYQDLDVMKLTRMTEGDIPALVNDRAPIRKQE